MTIGSGLFSRMRAAVSHLVHPGGGLAGELYDLRKDVLSTLTPLAAICVEELTNPAASGTADLRAATATTVAPQTATVFLAPGLAKLAALPRTLSLTTAGTTPADAPATALITGTLSGVAQTETVNVAQTAATVESTKAWSTVTSVAFAAAEGTGATVAIGVGSGMKLSKTPKSRAGAVIIIKEIVAGAVVTNGTLTVLGVYTPNTAPNDTNDYCVFYEYDAA